jgi:hypothetical protein
VLGTSCVGSTIVNDCDIEPIRPNCLKVDEMVIDIDNTYDSEETCRQIDKHNKKYEILKKLCS